LKKEKLARRWQYMNQKKSLNPKFLITFLIHSVHMTYPIKSDKNWLLAALLGASFGLSAQTADTSVTSTTTDANFGNTTVIFKTVHSNDMEVLNSVGSSFGMGDVVRITVAPPPPPPTAALPQATSAPKTTAATPATKPAPIRVPAAAPKPAVAAPLAAPQVAKPTQVATPKPAPKPVAQLATAPRNLERNVAQTTEAPKMAAAPKKVTKASASKSKTKKTNVRKSKKRDGFNLFSPRHKVKKHGKQRYGCPKF
jgi:hypothetical protein